MKQTHKELRLLAFLRHVERVFEANEGEEGQHRPLHDCHNPSAAKPYEAAGTSR